MGVYIPNMDMPKSCRICPLNSAPPSGCLIWTINDIREDKRNKDCPLIEIPTPHGRLIDTDELKVDFIHSFDYETLSEEKSTCEAYYSRNQILNTPAILEAENTEEINCKDCKYYTKKGDRWGECGLYNNAVDQMYSCVDAER